MGLFDKLKKVFLGEKTKETPEEISAEQKAQESAEEEQTAVQLEVEIEKEEALKEKAEASAASQTAEEAATVVKQESTTVENKGTKEAIVAPETPVQQVEEKIAQAEGPTLAEEEKELVQTESTDETQEEVPVVVEAMVAEETLVEEETTPTLSTEAEVEEIASSEEAVAQELAVEEANTNTAITEEEKYEKGIAKTRKTFSERLNALFANFRRVDEDFFEELEDTLISSDVGFQTSLQLTDALREEVKLKNAKKPTQVQNVIIEKMVDLYEAGGNDADAQLQFNQEGLTVILFVGVNGAGKTTTIGKLAYQLKAQGKKVLLAAADTFRAGAIHQLEVWGERAEVPVVTGAEGGDPASVVYDALAQAKAKNYDVLLVDTAGRLQNKVNLMNELAKMKRIIEREVPSAPQEVLLVLDATTGQNALSQAKQFNETTAVTGLVLTKLDGTAKGGVVLAIRNELNIPVKLVGLGEKIEDLVPFEAEQFAYGLFKGLWQED